MFITQSSFTSDDLAEIEGWENRFYSIAELIDNNINLKSLSNKLKNNPDYDLWVADAKKSLNDLINTSDMVDLKTLGVFPVHNRTLARANNGPLLDQIEKIAPQWDYKAAETITVERIEFEGDEYDHISEGLGRAIMASMLGLEGICARVVKGSMETIRNTFRTINSSRKTMGNYDKFKDALLVDKTNSAIALKNWFDFNNISPVSWLADGNLYMLEEDLGKMYKKVVKNYCHWRDIDSDSVTIDDISTKGLTSMDFALGVYRNVFLSPEARQLRRSRRSSGRGFNEINLTIFFGLVQTWRVWGDEPFNNDVELGIKVMSHILGLGHRQKRCWTDQTKEGQGAANHWFVNYIGASATIDTSVTYMDRYNVLADVPATHHSHKPFWVCALLSNVYRKANGYGPNGYRKYQLDKDRYDEMLRGLQQLRPSLDYAKIKQRYPVPSV